VDSFNSVDYCRRAFELQDQPVYGASPFNSRKGLFSATLSSDLSMEIKDYSARSASIGSMEAARRAGIRQAAMQE
jgi:hypothetical protein